MTTKNLFRHPTGALLYSDGVKYVADNGNAYWLIDAIASYQGDARITGHPRLSNFQFWRLTTEDSRGILTCAENTGCEPAIVKTIKYTDFPLDNIEVWVVCGSVPTEGGCIDTPVAFLAREMWGEEKWTTLGQPLLMATGPKKQNNE